MTDSAICPTCKRLVGEVVIERWARVQSQRDGLLASCRELRNALSFIRARNPDTVRCIESRPIILRADAAIAACEPSPAMTKAEFLSLPPERREFLAATMTREQRKAILGG